MLSFFLAAKLTTDVPTMINFSPYISTHITELTA